PLSGGGDSGGYRAATDVPTHDGVVANNYTCDEQCVATLGVELESGRSFTADEIAYVDSNSSYFSPVLLITRAMGKELFGEEDPLGKKIYDGLGRSATVIGVIRHMQGAWVNWDGLERIIMHPVVIVRPYERYLIRTEPGRRDALMPVIEKTLIDLNDERLVRRLTAHADVVKHSYAQDRTMSVILTVVISLMIAITALGIVGLASFSVNQRTRQIGIRRAIGARRIDILRYFLLENWMITTGGVVLGCVLALAFNYWLVSEYELPRLELVYVVGGIAGLLLLGQLAVLMPARRASTIAPAIATRNV
ncbi:MAG: FtsX-like permease family protein, partial [Pseudomonadota bacterium]